MKLKNKPAPKPGDDSFEQPPAGKFLLILVGVADIGTQPGGEFAPRECVLLRWELHSRKGPVKDEKGRIYTAAQTYSATVRGDGSNLKKALKNHGVEIGVNEDTDSHDWLDRMAWANLARSAPNKKNKVYTNIESFSPFDPEADDLRPPDRVLPLEHWEPADGCSCPQWANYWVTNSLDIAEYSSDLETLPKFGTKMEAVTSTPSDEDDAEKIPF